ncbi:MAG: CpaF/VirB11 family protein [Oscillospiraceae bacterium]
MSRHNLFFAPEQETDDFRGVLQKVQEHIAGQHSELLSDGNAAEAKAHIKRYIAKFVQDSRVAVRGMTQEQLVDALFTEMAEYSFLTKYIFGEGIEEIDINSWRDIEVQYSGGRCEKLQEHFDSPEHCINVLRRMLQASGTILDDQSPMVVATLAENIRIAVMKHPVVDASVGAAASIRIVNPHNLSKDDFISGGTATGEMLDFLSECVRYGISMCFAGATSSGKTTVAGWLLSTVPDNKRVVTIENGSRELSLVRETDGKVSNSVVHTITRNSENEAYCIDQIDLVDISLRFNPDIVGVGEMRGAEANAAQEIARAGVAVVTTIHANACEATYRRMVSLCKRAVDMSDETLMGYVTEAYPIIVFCKQLENKQRRLMEIMECEILPDNSRNYRTLFRYEITENRYEGNEFHITGSHVVVNPISDSLCKRLLENGMPQERINLLKGGQVSL